MERGPGRSSSDGRAGRKGRGGEGARERRGERGEWPHSQLPLLLLEASAVLAPFVPVREPGNDPFGSRPEPGAYLIASILLLPPGEVPEGRARGVQDTAAGVQSESER